MRVTAEPLGYQYSWFDSLCIWQDDTENWHSGSTHMAEVYDSVACNLPATGFPSGRVGSFTLDDTTLYRLKYDCIKHMTPPLHSPRRSWCL